MSVFVDTSALYATLSSTDQNHTATVQCWSELRQTKQAMVTSNYVLLETIALLGRRLGIDAVRDFQLQVVPLMTIAWVDRETHDRAISALLAAGQRDLSLVDCVSFEVMRTLRLPTAFVFDIHFISQGFQCIP